MTLSMFLSIMIPICIGAASLIVTMFISNNGSHKEIWKQINQNNNDITNRLTRIETKIEDLKNGKRS